MQAGPLFSGTGILDGQKPCRMHPEPESLALQLRAEARQALRDSAHSLASVEAYMSGYGQHQQTYTHLGLRGSPRSSRHCGWAFRRHAAAESVHKYMQGRQQEGLAAQKGGSFARPGLEFSLWACAQMKTAAESALGEAEEAKRRADEAWQRAKQVGSQADAQLQAELAKMEAAIKRGSALDQPVA